MRYKRALSVAAAVTVSASSFGILPARAEGGTDFSLKISAEKGVDIQDNMYGLFFEDISYAADGGLYAEKIENRNFEQIWRDNGNTASPWTTKNPSYAWSSNDAMEFYNSDESAGYNPLNDKNPTYMHFTGTKFSNQAYEGIYAQKGDVLNISFWAKSDNFTGSISAGADGQTVTVADGLTSEWKKYTAKLTMTDSVRKVSFDVILSESGTVDIDMISCIPDDAVEGVFRKDLAEKLKALNPGFLRFPGGCIIEGYDLENRYQWKKSVGPVEERTQNWTRWSGGSHWDYNQTLGIGYYEYLILCEYLDCDPIPVMNVGLSCEYNWPKDAVPVYASQVDGDSGVTVNGVTYSTEFYQYIQDALDLIEFCNGTDMSNEWAKLRADMGHSEPFNLTMLGIGNEQWQIEGNQWHERYEAFEDVIHKNYPDIKLIATAGPSSDDRAPDYDFSNAWSWVREKVSTNEKFAYAVDEHYYNSSEWFFDNTDRYDSYPRTAKVFAGEYAANTSGNTLTSALAEAAMLTGFERNADVVYMASYAPLFARLGYESWAPDMIFFNDAQSFGTPDYYTQYMYMNNSGRYTLKNELSNDNGEAYYASASYDEKTKDVIIKLVNKYDGERTASIDLSAINEKYGLAGKATEILLTGDGALAANSIAKPENVSPKMKLIDTTEALEYTMPAYSFAVLRVHTDEASIPTDIPTVTEKPEDENATYSDNFKSDKGWMLTNAEITEGELKLNVGNKDTANESASAYLPAAVNGDKMTISFYISTNGGSFADVLAYDSNDKPLYYMNLYGGGYAYGDTGFTWGPIKSGYNGYEVRIEIENGKSVMYVDDERITTLNTEAAGIAYFKATSTYQASTITIDDLAIYAEEAEPTAKPTAKPDQPTSASYSDDFGTDNGWTLSGSSISDGALKMTAGDAAAYLPEYTGGDVTVVSFDILTDGGGFANFYAYDKYDDPLLFMNLYNGGYAYGTSSFGWQATAEGLNTYHVSVVAKDGKSSMYVNDKLITTLNTDAEGIAYFKADSTYLTSVITIDNLKVSDSGITAVAAENRDGAVSCDISYVTANENPVVYSALYDAGGRMIAAVSGKSAVLGSGLDDGEYTLKAFLWDEEQNPLCDNAEKAVTVTDLVNIAKSKYGNPMLGFNADGDLTYGGDPAPLVDGDTVYVYVGQDVSNYDGAYSMPRWLVYSSKDLANWKYEGVALEENKWTIPWANSNSGAWAAQAIKYNGKYYFYFCTTSDLADGQECIGVAVSDSPTGPFTPTDTPLVNAAALDLKTSEQGWYTIDPTVWVDTDDGGVEHRYLNFGNTYNITCELNEDMISIKDIDGDGEITKADFVDTEFTNMDSTTYTEAAWFYRRQDESGNYYGPYYMFFADGWRESYSYAVTDDPMSGKWEYKGLFMAPNATANTSHGGVIDFNGKTYYVYHNGSLPRGMGYRRVANIQEFEFNADGSIDTLTELSTGVSGWGTSIISANGEYLGHEEFTNARDDASYPIIRSVTAGGSDGYNTAWEIKPGKADKTNEYYVSLQAVNKPGLYIAVSGDDVVLKQDTDGTAATAAAMTFRTVKALNGDDNMVSFESISNPGMYLAVSVGSLAVTDAPNAEDASFRFDSDQAHVTQVNDKYMMIR